MDKKTKIIDKSDLRKYRIELPNLIDDLGLSAQAFRLYARIKRVAGDSGYCNQGLRQMAEHCKMSLGAASSARKELLLAELIDISNGSKGNRETLVIADMWEKNFKHYFKDKPVEGVQIVNTCSNSEQGVHNMNGSVQIVNSGVQIVNTPIEEEERTHEEVTRKEDVGANAKKRVSQRQDCDDEFLKALKENPAYKGLDIPKLYGRMQTWCKVNKKSPTRRRFVNWLNREDVPMTASSPNSQNMVV